MDAWSISGNAIHLIGVKDDDVDAVNEEIRKLSDAPKNLAALVTCFYGKVADLRKGDYVCVNGLKNHPEYNGLTCRMCTPFDMTKSILKNGAERALTEEIECTVLDKCAHQWRILKLRRKHVDLQTSSIFVRMAFAGSFSNLSTHCVDRIFGTLYYNMRKMEHDLQTLRDSLCVGVSYYDVEPGDGTILYNEKGREVAENLRQKLNTWDTDIDEAMKEVCSEPVIEKLILSDECLAVAAVWLFRLLPVAPRTGRHALVMLKLCLQQKRNKDDSLTQLFEVEGQSRENMAEAVTQVASLLNGLKERRESNDRSIGLVLTQRSAFETQFLSTIPNISEVLDHVELVHNSADVGLDETWCASKILRFLGRTYHGALQGTRIEAFTYYEVMQSTKRIRSWEDSKYEVKIVNKRCQSQGHASGAGSETVEN